MLARLTIAMTLLVTILAVPARGAWLRTTDFALTTAHTLERGEVQIGVLGPLLYGVTSRVQIGLHPVLLIVGAPNLAARWRYGSWGAVEAAVDASVTWSLLGREDGAGAAAPATCQSCGFPGHVRLTTTMSWSVTPRLVLSLGAGAGLDLLDVTPSGAVARLQGAIHWLLAPDNLLALDLSGEVPVAGPSPKRGPTVQLLYARACGTARVGVGVAMGDFWLLRAFDRRERWFLYPVLDIWWRF